MMGSILINGLNHALILILISLGLMIVLGTLRVLNLTQSMFFLLPPVLWLFLTNFLSNLGIVNFWANMISLLLSFFILMGVCLAEVKLLMVFKGKRIHQLLVTYALGLIIYDLGTWIFGSGMRFISPPSIFKGFLIFFGTNIPKITFLLLPSGFVFMLFLWWLFNKTRIGVIIRAVSFRKQTCETLGINSIRIFTVVFILGGILSGIGGIIGSMWISISLKDWIHLVIEAFIVIVIGGIGSFKGVAVASIIIGLAYSITVFLIPNFSSVIVYSLLIVSLIISPTGIWGRRGF